MKVYKVYYNGNFYGETTDVGEAIGWVASMLVVDNEENVEIKVEKK